MQYNKVCELITPEFLKACCELSRSWEMRCAENEYYIQSSESCDMFFIEELFLNAAHIESIESLIFQAWQGFNWENKHENFIDLDSYNVSVRKNKTYTHFWFSEFEPDKPLSPEIQALIASLSYAMKLEAAEC